VFLCKLPTLSDNHFAPDLHDKRPSSPRPGSGAQLIEWLCHTKPRPFFTRGGSDRTAVEQPRSSRLGYRHGAHERHHERGREKIGLIELPLLPAAAGHDFCLALAALLLLLLLLLLAACCVGTPA